MIGFFRTVLDRFLIQDSGSFPDVFNQFCEPRDPVSGFAQEEQVLFTEQAGLCTIPHQRAQRFALRHDMPTHLQDPPPEFRQHGPVDMRFRVQQFVFIPVGFVVEIVQHGFHTVGQPVGNAGDQRPGGGVDLSCLHQFADVGGRAHRPSAQGDQNILSGPHAQGDEVFDIRPFIEVGAAQIDQVAVPVTCGARACLFLQQCLHGHAVQAALAEQPALRLG